MARSSRDRHEDDLDTEDIKALMQPGNYVPRKHRDRRMPHRKPRLSATEKR